MVQMVGSLAPARGDNISLRVALNAKRQTGCSGEELEELYTCVQDFLHQSIKK